MHVYARTHTSLSLSLSISISLYIYIIIAVMCMPVCLQSLNMSEPHPPNCAGSTIEVQDGHCRASQSCSITCHKSVLRPHVGSGSQIYIYSIITIIKLYIHYIMLCLRIFMNVQLLFKPMYNDVATAIDTAIEEHLLCATDAWWKPHVGIVCVCSHVMTPSIDQMRHIIYKYIYRDRKETYRKKDTDTNPVGVKQLHHISTTIRHMMSDLCCMIA